MHIYTCVCLLEIPIHIYIYIIKGVEYELKKERVKYDEQD